MKLYVMDTDHLSLYERGHPTRRSLHIDCRALEILVEPDREFAASIFLQLEVLPNAIYNNRTSEVRFYEEYFDAVSYWAEDVFLGTHKPKVGGSNPP